jgi:limonene-1,2-epoxide hydrolase
VRFLAGLGVVLAALTAGCGGGKAHSTPATPALASAARIARSWSTALNADNNDRAADLFAPGARVVQGGYVLVLHTHADAVRWNAALPCSGRIVRIDVHGNTATAEFVLGDRRASACDGPGRRAKAEFRIRGGKIVLWRQLATTQAPPAHVI